MTPATLPRRRLAAWTAAVLALHWLALAPAPGAVDLRDPPHAPPRFVTRSIEAAVMPALALPMADPPPAADAAAALKPMPPVDAPAPTPAPTPRITSKQPSASIRRAQAATNFIANEGVPELGVASTTKAIEQAETPAMSTDAPSPAAHAEPDAPAPVPANGAPALAHRAPALAAGSPLPPAPSPRDHQAAAAAFAIPGSVRLRYDVAAQARGLSWQAQAQLYWRHDGDTYEARLEVTAPFLPTRTQSSTGRITADGLAPTRFSDKSRSEEATHFERDKGKLTFSSNRPDAPLLAGAQDRLSVLLQLGAMIAGDPSRFPPATSITVQTASTREADPWLFTVEAEEQLQLPGGSLRALKLTRNPRREFDHKVELWLAPGMDYVPVRLRLTQPNGDWLDQQWTGTDKG